MDLLPTQLSPWKGLLPGSVREACQAVRASQSRGSTLGMTTLRHSTPIATTTAATRKAGREPPVQSMMKPVMIGPPMPAAPPHSVLDSDPFARRPEAGKGLTDRAAVEAAKATGERKAQQARNRDLGTAKAAGQHAGVPRQGRRRRPWS